MKATFQIAKIAVRELIYEKSLYLILLFAIVSLILSLFLGKLTYAEQSKLTLDFMLAGMHLSMVLFAIFMGIALFSKELTLGSISMVLSKPISRTSFLLGKLLGQLFFQLILLIGMMALTLLLSWNSLESFSVAAICQASFLVFIEVSVLSALAYLMTVNAQPLISALVTISLFFVGHLTSNYEALTQYKSGDNVALFIVRNTVPNLEVFNIKHLVSYGNTISLGELGWATAYGALYFTLFVLLAVITFKRKDVLT